MSASDVGAVRSGYATTSSRRLDFGAVPMRLFEKAERLAWDPLQVDLERDREDWAGMVDLQRDLVLPIAALFVAGEEAVTLDLLPLVLWAARTGRLEEEVYLTSFLHEEAKHTLFFRRWLDQVARATDDLHGYMGTNYRRIFLEELPGAMSRLLDDGSPAAVARAVVTYSLIVEGVLAETGYHSFRQLLEIQGLLPGLLQGVGLVARDESRHIRFALYLLRRLIAEDPSLWQVVRGRMDELVPYALGVQQEQHRWYLERARRELGEVPPEFRAMIDMVAEDIRTYGQAQVRKRMEALERARSAPLAELEAEIEEI
ncbi:MAG TPA: R2-like ligand-binding oxidase [Candidatus Dormibacteraeota bacterium]|jgi:ribonucleoside-diphosphate reductase beta chain|nr:R2-like ligand-binding oxidase [Candidatus Dormibacteraeota bacterium]